MPAQPSAPPSIAGCQILPADNIWNTRVDNLPLDIHSLAYVTAISQTAHVHADFGTTYQGAPNGIPFIVVPGDQLKVNINFVAWGDESDLSPYLIPPNAPIEGGPSSSADRHVLVLDRDHCILYELGAAYPNGDGT